jgi:hypothetical protein
VPENVLVPDKTLPPENVLVVPDEFIFPEMITELEKVLVPE